jgi:hypothetical protein
VIKKPRKASSAAVRSLLTASPTPAAAAPSAAAPPPDGAPSLAAAIAAAAIQAPKVVTSQTSGGDGTPPHIASHTQTPGGVGPPGTPSTLGTNHGTTTVTDQVSGLIAHVPALASRDNAATHAAAASATLDDFADMANELRLLTAAQSRARSSIASPHFNGCPPRELARQLLLNDSTDEFPDLTTQAQLQFIQAAYSRARSSAANPHSNGRMPP